MLHDGQADSDSGLTALVALFSNTRTDNFREATWSYIGGISGEIVNSAVRLTTSEMFWNLRFLTARGHIHENILLDKFLFFIRIDIFHTSCLKWYY